jgi:hypothetical protein
VRPFRLAAVLIGAIAAGGCLVLSLQPVYDDQSIAFEEGLVGRWDNTEDRTSVTIERAEWRSYKVTYTDRFATYPFHGNLTTIRGASFLDLTQPRGSDAGPYLVPVHAVYRLTITGQTLTAAALDYLWQTRAMNEKRPNRPAAALDDRRNAILVARTRDLRAWLAGAPADAFAAPMTFTRTNSESPE